MLENSIEKKCRDIVRCKGGMAIKLNPAGYRGIPDRLILLPGGHVLFAEFKRPGAKPRANQKLFLSVLRKMGFHADWFDSVEHFTEVISGYAAD